MTTRRDPLDESLVTEPYLEDEGFTERVLARLPARRSDPRPLILGVATALAAAIGVVALPGLVLGMQAALLGAAPSVPAAALLAAGAAAAAVSLGALTLAVTD
jgi:hypothetical protein